MLLQVCCTTIPELADVGFCIVNSGCVYATQLRVAVCTGYALRLGAVIGAAFGEVVAACARNLVVCGKRRVEVQNVPQKNAGLFNGIRFFCNRGNGTECCVIDKLFIVVMTHDFNVVHGQLRRRVHNGVCSRGHAAGA